MACKKQTQSKRVTKSQPLAPSKSSAPSGSAALPNAPIPTPIRQSARLAEIAKRRSSVFRLMALPQEIIDMVYIEMIKSGYLGILRTNHEVEERASPYVERYGVYRMILEDRGNRRYNDEPHVLHNLDHFEEGEYEAMVLKRKTVQSISRVQLRVISRKRTEHRYPSIIDRSPWAPFDRGISSIRLEPDHNWLYSGLPGQFIESSVVREFYHIILETNICDVGVSRNRNILEAIGMSTGFERLSIEFRKGAESPAYGWDPSTMVPYTKKKKMPWVEMIEQQLRRTLGPATFVDGTVPILKFEPLSYKKSLGAERPNDQVAD